jgi:hypothetical protein
VNGACVALLALPLLLHAQSLDLLQIASAKGITGAASPAPQVFLLPFIRDGQRRDTLILQAGGRFDTGIITANSFHCVSLVAAMPFNFGDGAVLKISVADGNSIEPAAELMLDPAHVRAHRKWIPVRFGIPAGRQQLRLVFEVTAGIRGDAIADWLGLAAGPESGCLFGSN